MTDHHLKPHLTLNLHVSLLILLMATLEATRKACEALYQVMGELDTFKDHHDLVSLTTGGAFEDCYEMLAELAIAKGLIKLPLCM